MVLVAIVGTLVVLSTWAVSVHWRLQQSGRARPIELDRTAAALDALRRLHRAT